MSVRLVYYRWRISPCAHVPGIKCLGKFCKANCAQKYMDYRAGSVPIEKAEKAEKANTPEND